MDQVKSQTILSKLKFTKVDSHYRRGPFFGQVKFLFNITIFVGMCTSRKTNFYIKTYLLNESKFFYYTKAKFIIKTNIYLE